MLHFKNVLRNLPLVCTTKICSSARCGSYRHSEDYPKLIALNFRANIKRYDTIDNRYEMRVTLSLYNFLQIVRIV